MIFEIADKIDQIGGNSYFVGGAVRDKFLGLTTKDIDVEVYGISKEELEDILSGYGKINYVGKSFGVYKIDNYDIAFPRTERAFGGGHKDFEIVSDPYLDPAVASSRRDFTINSIMKNIITGEVLDFHSGIKDIHNKIIRATNSERFTEDPLRILRAIQFASRFEFEIEKNTKEMIKERAFMLQLLSNDRIFEEIKKLLLNGKKPGYGLELMNELGINDVLFPEFVEMERVEQREEYHPEGNVFEHTKLAINYFKPEERNIELMLSILYHDVGKIDRITRSHSRVSGRFVEKEFPEKLTNNKEIVKNVSNLVENHMVFYYMEINKKNIKKLSLRVDIEQLIKLHLADKLSRGVSEEVEKETIEKVNKIREIYEEIKNEIQPIIMGRHLLNMGFRPGPEMGKMLKEIYSMQLDGKFDKVSEGIEVVKLHYGVN